MKNNFFIVSGLLCALLTRDAMSQDFQLNPGDIQITGVHADYPDGFSFVNWVYLQGGSKIKFTDCGFLSSGSANKINNFRGGEGNCVWTVPESGIMPGTVIYLGENGTGNAYCSAGGQVKGVLNGLAKSGDQIFVYTGQDVSSGSPSTFNGKLIYGFTFGSFFNTGGSWLSSGSITSNSSYLPEELYVSHSNMAQVQKEGNFQYFGARNNQPDYFSYRPMICVAQNWITLLSNPNSLNLQPFELLQNNQKPDSVIITEIMYNSIGEDEEWIELYNRSSQTVTLGPEWSIQNSVPFWEIPFPNTLDIPPGMYVTIGVGSSGTFPFIPDISIQKTSDRISNSGSEIILKKQAKIIDKVSFSDVFPWPADADGNGPTLSLNHVALENDSANSWGACKNGGTPGKSNISCHSSVYYSLSGGNLGTTEFNSSNEIWSDTPTGTTGVKPEIDKNTDLIIRQGHQIVMNQKGITVRNIRVEKDASLSSLSSYEIPCYITIYGNISNDGLIGGIETGSNGISFNIEGPECLFGGSGKNHLCRIRKSKNDSKNTRLSIETNINLNYNGTSLYNEKIGTVFDILLGEGKTLSLIGANGNQCNLSIDGIDGSDGGVIERGGTFSVNGTLLVSGKIYAVSDNSLIPARIILGSKGTIHAREVDVRTLGPGLKPAEFSIESGGKLYIDGLLRCLGGTFATGNALYLGQQGIILDGENISDFGVFPGGNLTGYPFIECNSGNFDSHVFNFWSSPVRKATTEVLIKNNNSANLFIYDPELATGGDVKGLQQGWKKIPLNSEMLPGKGYINTGSGMVLFRGEINSGMISIPVRKTSFSPFNLIGNPYPGPIEVRRFIEKNGPEGKNTMTGALYFWDDDRSAGKGFSAADYIVCNILGSTEGGNVKKNMYNGNIAKGQGFFIEALENGEVIFDNSMRNIQNGFFFEDNPVGVTLKIRAVLNDSIFNETLIALVDDATDSRDYKYDAVKITGNNPIEIFTTISGNHFAIQALPSHPSKKIIPLGLHCRQNGSVKISMAEFSGLDDTQPVYLEDKEKGIIHDLRNSPYSIMADEMPLDSNRFYIHLLPGIIINTGNGNCLGENGFIQIESEKDQLWEYEIFSEKGEKISVGKANQRIENLQAGIYTVKISHINGFSGTFQREIKNFERTYAKIRYPDSVYMGEPAIFFVSGIKNELIKWNFGDGTEEIPGNNVLHRFDFPGNYLVKAVIMWDSCIIEDSGEILVKAQSDGVHDGDEIFFNLYPVPANNWIILELKNSEKVFFEIRDLTGKIIKTDKISSQKQCIDMNALPEGLYQILIFNEKYCKREKIIIRR